MFSIRTFTKSLQRFKLKQLIKRFTLTLKSLTTKNGLTEPFKKAKMWNGIQQQEKIVNMYEGFILNK